jgi:hypothetical protein
MTAQYASYEAPPQAVTAAGAPRPRERRCARCGGVGTHYLTCAGLRLPSGYRFSDDTQAPDGEQADWVPLPRRRLTSGPGHPDWPRPPQR